MAIRNGLKGGLDYTEEGLKPSDQNDTNNSFYRKVYADNTGGTIAESTTETDLATITITQNDLQDNFSILVSAGLEARGANSNNNVTFRLYIGGVVVKTETVNTLTSAARYVGASLHYKADSLDSTAGNIIVKITGQNSAAGGLGDVATVRSMLVDAINNNS